MPLSLFALLLPLRTALRCTVVTLLVAMGLSPALAHASLQLKLGHAPTAVTDTVVTPRVHAQLVAWAPQGVAPGRPFELGLRLVHSDGWHTYWKNAGDSGLPTAFNWQLPAGMRTDAVDWPTPQQIRVGDLLNYGYEGTVLLPVATQISPAFTTDADGQVQIGLHATWLVCRVECIPEEGEFQLRLPADVPHTGWASEFDRAHAQAPVALPQADARVTVHESGERIALRVAGLPAAAQGQTLALYPEASETFQHAAVLGQDWTQMWDGGVWTATFPLSNLRGATPDTLAWVIGLSATGSDIAHTPPAQAWRVQAPVQGRWAEANFAPVSPALTAALAANQAAADAARPSAPDRGTVGTLWLAVIGGLIGGMLLNLMPCVFPVLAIKLMGLARHGADRRSQRHHGAAYAAGVVLSFTALGGLLLVLRAAGEQLGWGFQLQSPWMVAALAVLFTLIALNLGGLWELRHVVPDRIANAHARHPLADAFVSGIVAVAIASPCTAPFMGASLGFAVNLPGVQALAVFVALGVGMALPYVFISAVPGWIRWLPQPGAWMDTFRHAMAFPMLATVVWLVWVLGQQAGIDGAASLLALLLCVAALVWALGLRGRSRAALVVLALAAGLWMAHGLQRHVQAPPPLAAQSEGAGWQVWSPERQAALLAQGRPVFVDYTAAWCVTCQYNKRTTLANAQVLAAFAERQVALLRADWTRRDPAITQALATLGRSGVPVYVLLVPGQAPVVLSELLSTAEVLGAVARIAPSDVPDRKTAM